MKLHLKEPRPLLYLSGNGSSNINEEDLFKMGCTYRCFIPGTPIWTNKGFKLIEKLSIGDRVLTGKGRFCKITDVLKNNYDGKVYTVSRKKWTGPESKITVTAMHPLLTESGYIPLREMRHNPRILFPDYVSTTEGFYRRLYVSDYFPSSYRLIGKGGRSYWALINGKLISPMRGTVLKNKVGLTTRLFRLIGYYLAEGFTRASQVCFAFHKNEFKYHRDVKRLMKRIFGLRGQTIPKGNAVELVFTGRPLVFMFEKLFGRDSYTKKVPNWFLNLHKDRLKHLLQGYFKGDGHWNKGSVQVGTASSRLAQFIFLIFTKLKFRPSVQMRNLPQTGTPFWVFRFCKNTGGGKLSKQINFGNCRKDKITPTNLRKSYLPIESKRGATYKLDIVSKRYHGLVYNLEVEHDHSYVVGYLGAVHNCYSYAYTCPGAFYYNKRMKEALDTSLRNGVGVMMDSAAHSIHVLQNKSLRRIKGKFKVGDIDSIKDIVMDHYTEYAKKEGKKWDFYVNFDFVKNAKIVYAVQKELEKKGIRPIPVYHGDMGLEYLERYCKEGYKLIGLGTVKFNSRYREKRGYYDRVFNVTEKHGVLLHGFAVTSLSLMHMYPFYSVDSATWAKTAAYGSILYVDQNRNTIGEIHVTDNVVGGKTRYAMLPKNIQRDIRHSVEDDGFDMHELQTDGRARSLYNVHLFCNKIEQFKEIVKKDRSLWRSLLA